MTLIKYAKHVSYKGNWIIVTPLKKKTYNIQLLAAKIDKMVDLYKEKNS